MMNKNFRCRKAKWYFLNFFIFLTLCAQAQNGTLLPEYIIVDNVFITGNTVTKTHIIQREMPFDAGDTILASRFQDIIAEARKNIYNLELFLSVSVYYENNKSGNKDVIVLVKERWYTLPLPYVELADRSFNVWWQKYNADLRRLSYGGSLQQQNFTGRNDDLDILVTGGFNKRLGIEYTTPYLTKGMKTRMKFGFQHIGSNELPYISNDSNKLLYYQSDHRIRRTWEATASFIVRQHIKKKEWFRISLNGINLFDSIQVINPDFFKQSESQYVFPEIEYKMKYDDVDNVMYPLIGSKYEVVLSKRGVGWSGNLNRLFASGFARLYMPIGRDWFTRFEVQGQIMVPFEQSFYNTKALGYGNHYIRGYEFYVIDGVTSFVLKADLKKKIAFFEFPTFFKAKDYRKIPFAIYGKVFSDIGAAHNRVPSMFGNKLQLGAGVGFDIVTIHDMAVSINFAINSIGQKGVYLHQE